MQTAAGELYVLTSRVDYIRKWGTVREVSPVKIKPMTNFSRLRLVK